MSGSTQSWGLAVDSLTIELPWPSAALSPNARVHHFTLHRAKKAAKNYAWGMTKAAMGPLGIPYGAWVGPISVQYTFHPEIDRARDDDNFAARMKAARDGIASALGVDDKTFTMLPVAFGAKRKPACVVVTLQASAVNVPLRGQING